MDTLNKLLSMDSNYLLVGLIVVFYAMEQLFATQFKFEKRPVHFFHNFMMVVVFMACNIFWVTVMVNAIEWFNANEIGLFHLFTMPVWLKLILSVMLFDLVTYWFHRIGHLVPVLWRFHRVHHSDTSMDATTPLRGHPLETMFWFGSGNILAAAIFGLDLFGLGLYFLISVPFFVLEHSNLKFPVWIDKTFGLVFTTPNVHKIHHDQDQFYTDSNFADIFILWDRIFGTYKYKAPELVTLGLKEFEGEKKQTFWYLLISPFVNMQRREAGSGQHSND